MTCSSSTISRPDPSLAPKRRRAGGWQRKALTLLLPALLAVPLALMARPGRGEETSVAALIEEARGAIARGDGIDGEAKLRSALDRGASRADVAAFMGEAYLAQDNRDKAREWLASGTFSPQSAAGGWRALARLERLDGNLGAAGKAFDKALAITPDDAGLWVEIARLRYSGGQHRLAISAAGHALQLDPGNARALEFRGQLARDRYGLLAAMPWFEKALRQAPDDVSVMLEYAATLGDLGRASDCLTLTRQVLKISPGHPRAYYLQAVLAARAGNHELARSLLAHTDDRLDGQPGVLLLRGVSELGVGNPAAASELFERVLRMRPDNRQAQELLARSIYLSGEYRYATLRFRDQIAHDDASPYLLTVVARAYEALGDRQRAGELLDLAARPQAAALRVLPGGNAIGAMLARGEASAAEAQAEAAQRSDPGFFDNLSLAGDVQLALGRPQAAQARYIAAAQIRMPAHLFARRFEAYMMAGDIRGAQQLVGSYLRESSSSREALRAGARLAMVQGDTVRALAVLRWLRDNGGARDVRLLCDLALIEADTGDVEAAEADARAAYRLQRSSPVATQALAYSYASSGRNSRMAAALLDKAQAMLGDTPLIAATRRKLSTPGEG
ncbi:tetratricopeptide repeat protein [Novosphingobium sp. KN65.2]|uniref:tetratricopeptide repeat protein n=1 Tax=Novosphingobium sp. KN65.2 TaxID=1478134 RepID=UPI0005DD021B|nr:tetratricopeptide repeat protein [Novosphingobium sp. KN65.2]CDO36720.1 putative TPR repeat-containing protein [Novosphingobium sp. KN65.2]